MRCLQIVLKVLSVSNCSFYTPNKDPDTPAWILTAGGTGRAALHLAVWSPISCGLTPCHIPPVALGTAPATWSRLTQPSACRSFCLTDVTLSLGKKTSDG